MAVGDFLPVTDCETVLPGAGKSSGHWCRDAEVDFWDGPQWLSGSNVFRPVASRRVSDLRMDFYGSVAINLYKSVDTFFREMTIHRKSSISFVTQGISSSPSQINHVRRKSSTAVWRSTGSVLSWFSTRSPSGYVDNCRYMYCSM